MELPLAEFVAASRSAEPVHGAGSPGRFAALFGWNDLSRLLETTPLAPPRLELIRNGGRLGDHAFMRSRGGVARLDAGMIAHQLDHGATLLVNFADDLSASIARLCDDLADALAVRTSANVYASWRAEPGLSLHADHHGVLVLQLAGRKRWTVHAPVRRDPLEGDAFAAPADDASPVWEGLLEEGGWLYLPRGYPHVAAAIDGPSLHLTIALSAATAHGYLSWLVDELRDDPRWRAALERSDPEDLRAAIAGAIDAGSIARYLATRKADKVARPRFAFPALGRTEPAEWTAATALRLSSRRALAATWGEAGGQIAVGPSAWNCAPAVAAALARLSDRVPVALGELESGLPPSDRAELRRLLGVLHLRGGLASSADGVS